VDAFVGYTLAGIATGAIYAIAATGLVVTYTTSGVFNFAHGATGMIMAFLYWQLRVDMHWAAPAALVVVLLVAAPLYGVVIERILIRPLDPGDTGTTLVATLGLLVMSLGVAYTIWPVSVDRVILPFYGPSAFVNFAGNRIPYQELITIALAAFVALSLRFLFFRTRIGVAMRGVVDDRPLMALNGGYPYRLNALSWAIGASLGALGGILQSGSAGGLQVLDLTFLVVNAFAAALLGRLRSLPLTFAGALALGLLVEYVTGYVTLNGWMSNLKPVLPTFFLFAILLIIPPVRLRAGAATVTNALRVPTLRTSVAGAVAFLAVAALVEQFLQSGVLIGQAAEGVAVGVVGLSVVLLTGYGGQVSLAQYAFMGFGAWIFGEIAPGGGILGLVGVALVCAGLGAIVALPTLRLRGLYLALSTLAFAELAYFLFFDQTSVMGSTDFSVPRVNLPGLSLTGAKANLFFECVVFALFAVGILAVRRGSVGRLLMATRDSSAASATLGANLTLIKLLLFAGSSAIAGVGGALWGGVEREVTSLNFEYQLGLSLVLIVYIWGVCSPSGALLGGLSLSLLYPQIVPHLPSRWSQAGLIATGLGAVSLGRNPNGVIGQMSSSWQLLRSRAGALGTLAGGPLGGGGRPAWAAAGAGNGPAGAGNGPAGAGNGPAGASLSEGEVIGVATVADR
jgi:branched-chain amino acid transport system permease protein